MATDLFDLIEVTPEADAFVECSFEIADQIREILRTQGKNQRDLAEMLDKKEPEISRMLSGMHNFTIRTITRLQVALGASIIVTPRKVREEAHKVTLHGQPLMKEISGAEWKRMVSVFSTSTPDAQIEEDYASYSELDFGLPVSSSFVMADSEELVY